jgi:hypothetical protein
MTQAANLAALGTNAGTTGILPIAGGGTAGTNGAIGFKNRLINGNMTIAQRQAVNTTVTPTNGQYVLDRWQYNLNQASKFTTVQTTANPVNAGGNNYCLGITSSSAYSVAAGDYFTITQPIEGYNVADLAWGTSAAKTVTLSAWVYSSLTGTFGGSLMNGAFNYAYPFTYTISSANTWTQISVTVAGPTAGTWPTDNSSSLQVNFGLGVGTTYSGTAGAWTGSLKFSATGAVSVVGTSGATFYITGVQLEVGTAATNFDFRSIGTEVSLCQRYFESSVDIGEAVTSGTINTFRTALGTYSSNQYFGPVVFKINKRAQPTITFYSEGNSAGNLTAYNTSTAVSTSASAQNIGTACCAGQLPSVSGYTFVQGKWSASAEL